MANDSITKAVPKALADYLKSAVPKLQKAYTEFPASHEKLSMPCVSVFASTNAQFRPLMPYMVAKPTDAEISVANKFKVKWVVGIYDFNLQIDLWTRNKEERDDMFDMLFNALNPDINPMGLVLNLEDYFGQLCDYLYVGHTFPDSSERSDRDEWRVTLSVLVTCKAIRERSEFIITDPATAPEIEDAGQIDSTVVVVDE